MKLSDFDFDLPEELIALRPARPRDSARLLVVRPPSPPQGAQVAGREAADYASAPSAGGAAAAGDAQEPCGRPLLTDAIFRDLPRFLRAGDVLVFNDTRVIPAMLTGRRVRQGADSMPKVVANLHKREDAVTWRAFARPARKLQPGDRILFGLSGAGCSVDELWGEVVEKGEGGEIVLRFSCPGQELDAALARVGDMPLPPYIAARRKPDVVDRQDYQTIFAEREGAVAAPTAGLHFTPELLERLQEAGVQTARITLHVGAGTFLPVKVEEVEEHRMHAEYGEVPAATAELLNDARARGGRIVCVGTTTVRILETAADDDGRIRPFAGETDIFIRPGYRFRATDLMITNFHLPRSTLFMLVSAFSGLETMRAAYAHAVAQRYRFYSYGDACLLHPAGMP